MLTMAKFVRTRVNSNVTLHGAVIKRRGPGIFTGYYERGPPKEIPRCLIPRLLCCISLAT